jgi:hypothetical protein
MAEQAVTGTQNAAAGGIQAGTTTDAPKTFTQAELDAVIADRLKREREKYADFETLKKKATDYDKLTEAQKDELTKAQERATKAEAESARVLAQANERIIMASFVAEAAKQGATHPGDAYALADRSAVTIDANGNVTGVDKAVEAVVKAGRLPIKTAGNPPDINAANQGGTGKLTQEQLREQKMKSGMYSKM